MNRDLQQAALQNLAEVGALWTSRMRAGCGADREYLSNISCLLEHESKGIIYPYVAC